METQLTMSDIAKVSEAVGLLESSGAWSVSILGYESTPEVQVHHDTMDSIIEATGIRPTVRLHGYGGPYWEASIITNGIRFNSLLTRVQLRQIGFAVTEREIVFVGRGE